MWVKKWPYIFSLKNKFALNSQYNEWVNKVLLASNLLIDSFIAAYSNFWNAWKTNYTILKTYIKLRVWVKYT